MIDRLRRVATRAAKRAYAPYSRFSVGAAVLASDGRIYSGSNIENASYGLTVCAERNAVFGAIGSGARRVRAVVIVAGEGRPAPPCGACRQVIREFGEDVPIVSFSADGAFLRSNISALLPRAFGAKLLVQQSGGPRGHE